ncbi:hypothetical protein Y032_0015g2886 [Ancylostoma ceylanicum]|uniref:Uncharacterized protein n=1 Tax=Ancylostoma ceylanicum TaxID=53326 RepID=A0A016VAW6_9BILA|nr:hypothetical protein Y032_0015g2886 [Ancylostoma ceylanicum]
MKDASSTDDRVDKAADSQSIMIMAVGSSPVNGRRKLALRNHARTSAGSVITWFGGLGSKPHELRPRGLNADAFCADRDESSYFCGSIAA